jgi:hypothetical protein
MFSASRALLLRAVHCCMMAAVRRENPAILVNTQHVCLFTEGYVTELTYPDRSHNRLNLTPSALQ